MVPFETFNDNVTSKAKEKRMRSWHRVSVIAGEINKLNGLGVKF
jgi:hypothetical protein